MLLAVRAKVTNTGLRWEAGRQKLADLGHGPVVIEPATGTVALRRLGAVRGLRVRPLSAEGRPLEEDPAARLTDGDGRAGWATRRRPRA